MSNIKNAFLDGKAFIPFITCGDPDLDTTYEVVCAAAKNGADLIELGIPFSDPTAEGPVIQSANIRALAGGVTTDNVFDLVVRLRKEISIPLVFMTYANVVFSYGIERFMKRCSETGVDGVILPDVPFSRRFWRWLVSSRLIAWWVSEVALCSTSLSSWQASPIQTNRWKTASAQVSSRSTVFGLPVCPQRQEQDQRCRLTQFFWTSATT